MAGGHLTPARAAEIRERFGTPCYVYDRAVLEAAARQALAFPAPFGFTLRYAMKANPSLGILKLFRGLGLHLDASSDFEVERALRAGFAPSEIQLTSQMPSRRLGEFLGKGVLFNACSLHQLEAFGQIACGRELSVRLNPGLGSGSTNRTNTGGPGSSFGIWHEYLGDVNALADRYDLKITRLHSHIGSGTDPEVFKRATRMTLDLAAKLELASKTLLLHGGPLMPLDVSRHPVECHRKLARFVVGIDLESCRVVASRNPIDAFAQFRKISRQPRRKRHDADECQADQAQAESSVARR